MQQVEWQLIKASCYRRLGFKEWALHIYEQNILHQQPQQLEGAVQLGTKAKMTSTQPDVCHVACCALSVLLSALWLCCAVLCKQR